MAVVDEMLEAEPAPRIIQFVGANRLAHGLAGAMGLEIAQNKRAQFHMATVYVRLRSTRRDDGQDGQDLFWEAAEDQDAQRIASRDPPEPVALPAGRLRRFAG